MNKTANELFIKAMKIMRFSILKKEKGAGYYIYDEVNCRYRGVGVYTAREVVEELSDFLRYYLSVLNLEIHNRAKDDKITDKLKAEPEKFVSAIKSFEHSNNKKELAIWRSYKDDIEVCDLLLNHIDEVNLEEVCNHKNTTWIVVFQNTDTGKCGMDYFTEINKTEARKSFRECYRHNNYTILSVIEKPEIK